MPIKWIGALFVVLGCGSAGFCICAIHKQEESALYSFKRMLCYMQWELQYHLIPLPELCRNASKETKNVIRKTMADFSEELEKQIMPDAASCMKTVICRSNGLSPRFQNLFRLLGESLGRFDLASQIQGLESVQSACQSELDALNENRDSRLRSYQTLGVCAGAALAILLI